MKYGETLRQRSIPAWSTHNIDYDDIKHLIKERTTPGHGKTIAIPGRGDEQLVEFEDSLFFILEDQHSRIDLFVRSKAGEIRRRIDHSTKQLKRLCRRDSAAAEAAIPIERLERYSRLESDLLKAGDEIKSLARFVGAQRTAFRKLLKKYKKWTGSANLEARFREEVIGDAKSFTQLDLGPLLDDYSEALQSVRSLYESRLQQSGSPARSLTTPVITNISSVERLSSGLAHKSRVDFDTAVGTIPLGPQGSLANYFVHKDNVVELQILLLQYLEYYFPRSRSNSTVHCQAYETPNCGTQDSDYSILVGDCLETFARDESALTVNEREHPTGLPPQRAKVAIRWNTEEDAILSVRSSPSKVKSAPLKTKHISSVFNKGVSIPTRKSVDFTHDVSKLAAVRAEVFQDSTIRPLYKISSCRSRFIGLETGARGSLFATLDTDISMHEADEKSGIGFPYAVLHIREEDAAGTELLSVLDNSHLVERVRGFSLHYQALWQIYMPTTMVQPFWIPMLSQDIRKLPPAAVSAAKNSSPGSSDLQSATQRSASTAGGTTAVETGGQSSSAVPDKLQTPPLRAFRKKRRRTYAESLTRQARKYWSEYDHPEYGQYEQDAYVVYCDPNEKSTLDQLFDRVGRMFWRREPEAEALLPSPINPEADETSSDEETAPGKPVAYGTVSPHSRRSNTSPQKLSHTALPLLPYVTSICFIASITTLVFAYILATTSKRRYANEVHVGMLFAIICSISFTIAGFVPLFTRREGSWLSFSIAITVLVIVAIASGALFARMLG